MISISGEILVGNFVNPKISWRKFLHHLIANTKPAWNNWTIFLESEVNKVNCIVYRTWTWSLQQQKMRNRRKCLKFQFPTHWAENTWRTSRVTQLRPVGPTPVTRANYLTKFEMIYTLYIWTYIRYVLICLIFDL